MCSVPQWICIYIYICSPPFRQAHSLHSNDNNYSTERLIDIFTIQNILFIPLREITGFFYGKLRFSVRLKVPWAGRGTANIICCKNPNRVHESESDLSASHYSAIMYLAHKLSLSHYSHFCSFVDLFFRNQRSGAWGQEWSRVGVMQRDSKKCRL